MKVLAVDTALGACSVAVMDGGRVAAHRWTAMPRGHAEALAPMVGEAMAEAGFRFADLDRLGVTTGPGTFTGQRVGLAFMRGLRLALDRPLVGLTTLETMAAAAVAESGASPVAVLHEAKRGEVYVALFHKGSAVIPVQVAPFEAAMAEIATVTASMGPPVLAGTGAEAAAAWMAVRGNPALLSSVRQPDALWVARLALEAAAPSVPPNPLYLRAPDAKLAARAVRLRAAAPSDSESLGALHAESLPEAWDAPFFAQALTAPGGFALIAEAGGVPLGFILARAVADEAEILTLAVSAAYRCNGIGGRLLRKAAVRAAELGAANLFLEVAAGNGPAQKLYESHGFRAAGRRKGYYGGGEDALLLRSSVPLDVSRLGNGPDLD